MTGTDPAGPKLRKLADSFPSPRAPGANHGAFQSWPSLWPVWAHVLPECHKQQRRTSPSRGSGPARAEGSERTSSGQGRGVDDSWCLQLQRGSLRWSGVPRPRPLGHGQSPRGSRGPPQQRAPGRTPVGTRRLRECPPHEPAGESALEPLRAPRSGQRRGSHTCPAPTSRASLGPVRTAPRLSRRPNDGLPPAGTRLEQQSPALCRSQRDTWHWLRGSLRTGDSPRACRVTARRGQRTLGPTRRMGQRDRQPPHGALGC